MDSIINSARLLPALAGLTGLLLTAVASADVRGAGDISSRGAPAPEQAERLYIVQFNDPPALAAPGVSGKQVRSGGLLAGTAETRRFDPQSFASRNAVRRLQEQQNRILQTLGIDHKKVYSYRYTFNGVAIKLTPRQADALRLHKHVKRVWEDRRRSVSTASSPAFLGLLDNDGGLRSDLGLQGEGIVIGVIDSGITPNHPSFADRAVRDKPRLCESEWAENSLLGLWLCRRFKRPGPPLFSGPPEDWRGVCETGENFTADDCNDKLIGARWYVDGFLFDDGFDLDVNEFLSPADADGHGTHIASIAAGNAVDADIFGRNAGRISGVAPRARIAAYKACWLEPGGFRATCSVADLVLAIDDAVADGVDIINYSVGSLDDSLADPDDLALLRAAEAGVLSVVATGNDGPEAFTMLAPATTPWVLSVGATSRTGTRIAEGLRVNKPASLATNYESKEGSVTWPLTSTGPITGELVLVDDNTITTPEGESGTTTDLCSAAVNAADIDGNIAFIQRGGCDFVDKILFAQQAGAVAVVVFSNDRPLQVMAGDDTGIDIPGVMISQADGQLLRDKLAEGDSVEVTLDKSIFINFAEAGNVMGSFSGRGPSLADPDFIKPDVVAPGVNILGGQTPDVANGFRGEDYQYLSGTSQSAPHVAGLAALIKEQHPDWTPAAIKSALMTTARQDIAKQAGGAAADPFDMGAGHVVPNNAIDPGLVYDTAVDDYDAYLCYVDLARKTPQECAALPVQDVDAKDVNLPSAAVTELVAYSEITREVSNPGAAASFRVEIDAPPELEVTITPDTLTVSPGQPETFTVRFATNNAPLNQWLFGSYTWVSDTHRVRSPFAVQPTQIAVSEQISGSGATGSADVEVRFGYNGSYSAVPLGLELPCVLPDNNPDDTICTNTEPATVFEDPLDFYQLTFPAEPWVYRTAIDVDESSDLLLRVSLFDALTNGDDDLDLYVWYCTDENNDNECEAETLVGSASHDGTSDEQVNVFEPEPGTYIIDVHGFELEGLETQFCILAWGLGRSDSGGNLALDGVPGSATAGAENTFSAIWSGLADGLWLGGVLHRQDMLTELGLSIIDVDVNGLPVQNSGAFSCP